jgi:hypothetical protein
VHNVIFYQQNSYNWTEADMVYVKPGELVKRLDYRYAHPEDEFNVDDFTGQFTFDINIESYNRLYNTPEYLPIYTNKTQTNFGSTGPQTPPTYEVKKDADGNDISILDPRTGEFVPYYLHTKAGEADLEDGHTPGPYIYSFVHL